MINCIVPTHRPGRIAGIIAAIRAQTVSTRAIVVENGPAIGACLSQGLDVDVVLTSREQAPAARNVGLRFVQSTGGGIVSFFDDDDIYLPRHLATLLRAWPCRGVVGRSAHYLRTREGRLLFLDHYRDAKYVMVQSMLCESADVGPWDESLPVEEVDVAWCQGKRLTVAPPEHFAFDNGDWPHLWAPDDIEWPVRCPAVYDLGAYDPEVVQGNLPPTQYVLQEPSFEALDSMMERARSRRANGTY